MINFKALALAAVLALGTFAANPAEAALGKGQCQMTGMGTFPCRLHAMKDGWAGKILTVTLPNGELIALHISNGEVEVNYTDGQPAEKAFFTRNGNGFTFYLNRGLLTVTF